MTDNEIIKALESLLSKAGHENHKCCRGCVYEERCKTECGANIVEDALALINRLIEEKKALIVTRDSLIKCLSNKKEIISEMDEEIERLKEIKYAYNSLFK